MDYLKKHNDLMADLEKQICKYAHEGMLLVCDRLIDTMDIYNLHAYEIGLYDSDTYGYWSDRIVNLENYSRYISKLVMSGKP